VHRLARKRAIEIDDVEIFEALRGEHARLHGRIVVKEGRARHVALFEPHALAVLQVDRREEDHGVHFRKFAISRKPSRWLFSGWNWVPTMVSRPTIAVTG